MGKSFLSIDSNYNNFSSIPSSSIDNFLLENNEQSLSKIYSFAQKPEGILIVSGFVGTGKTQIVNHLLNYLDKDVCSLKIYCSNSITLDDVLLSLWSQFISDSSNTEIAYKYRQTKSFQDKVSGYFADSNSNIVITVYNFDLITEQNRNEIVDFLTSVSISEKIKVIIVSKTFDTSLFSDNIKYTKVILKALSRNIFEKLLCDNGIKTTSRMFDELYKITRGYYLYTVITAKILNKKDLSVNDYLAAYVNSGLPFDKFLAKAFVSMLPNNCVQLLHLLSLIRHPVNSQILDYLESYDESAINILAENLFLQSADKIFIVNNYFTNEIIEKTDDEEKSAIHKKLVTFYNSQLPLKPSERLYLISRATMRYEIEYHINAVPVQNNNISLKNTQQNLSLEDTLSYAKELTNSYKYNDAINIYLQLLEHKETDKWFIYEHLAELYDKLGNSKYALHYLLKIIEHYKEIQDTNDKDKYKLKIAQIYYRSYKTTEAIRLLYEIISESTNSEITIDAYTWLGNIYISQSSKNKAYELYSKAIVLAERENINTNLPELYFKFALLADENDEPEMAINYYKRCIENSHDNSKYKSLSYSNLGDFYLDIENTQQALINFQAAYKLDEMNSNDYGMYYTASNIAQIIVKTDSEEGYKYLKLAKVAAIKTNDIYAMANSGLHLGDYFANISKPDSALKEYFSVLNLVKDNFNEDNKKRIMIRINDIKLKIGEEKFNEITNQ